MIANPPKKCGVLAKSSVTTTPNSFATLLGITTIPTAINETPSKMTTELYSLLDIQ